MRWTLKAVPEIEKIKALAQEIPTSEIIACLLLQRGIETRAAAKEFFNPDLKKLHDPFLMKDMDKAVKRIQKALNQGERILVYGDYDVDGTTSVALMASYLRTYSDAVDIYIPDREKEGYGISKQGVDYAADNEIYLIVALDCGIKAVDQIDYATERGIEFIICDHHLPGETIPKALAVLDPKRADCEYPFKELCGCGVGFKLIQALHQNQGKDCSELEPYLDLVATAIGADIVPVLGENRILAYHGLRALNTNPRPGLKALLGEKQSGRIRMTQVVFQIAPRINAAGRMDQALRATELLMEKDLVQARILAQQIEDYNSERKYIDQEITQKALLQIKEAGETENFTTVVYQEDWHKGVIGIVASRLTETYYRPTLVFTKSGDKLAASGRSVKGFSIYSALEACAEHIEQFGGHKYAAGLTLNETQYAFFKEKFEKVVAESIDKKLLIPEILIDLKLDFRAINMKFMNTLNRFAPFGPGNMRPVFITENLYDTGYAKGVGEDENHLKCSLTPSPLRKNGIGAIGFNLGEKLSLLKEKILLRVIDFEKEFDYAPKRYSPSLPKPKRYPSRAIYSLEINEWKNRRNLQLNLKDIDSV